MLGSKSSSEKRKTDTHILLTTLPFVGSINSCWINDYKRVLQSRVICDLGLYWPVHGSHKKIIWNGLREPQGLALE